MLRRRFITSSSPSSLPVISSTTWTILSRFCHNSSSKEASADNNNKNYSMPKDDSRCSVPSAFSISASTAPSNYFARRFCANKTDSSGNAALLAAINSIATSVKEINTKLDGLEGRFSSQFMKWYAAGVGALASAFLGMSFLIGRNDKDVHDKITSNDKALSDKFSEHRNQTAAEVAAVRATTNCVDSKLTGLMSGGAVNGRVEDSLNKGYKNVMTRAVYGFY